jgi:hypothetical protein
MSLETSLLISAILLVVMIWILRSFFDKHVTSGQALFWLASLSGGIVLALFPAVIHRLSVLWGGLWPVSWITFASLVLLSFYLLYLTVRLNRLSTINELARTIAFLERRVRELERKSGADAAPGR